MSVFCVIKSLSATSSETIAASPSSIVSNTNASTLTPVEGFVIITVSPGKKVCALIYIPAGKSPRSATDALPSIDGFDVAKSIVLKHNNANSFTRLFFILIPS